MSTTGKLVPVLPSGKWWEDIKKLDHDHFPRPWKDGDWESINFSQHRLWAWQNENTLVGMALFQALHGDETAHLLKILIRPEYRGSEEASQFWTEIIQGLRALHYKSIYLEVEESNHRAKGFYQKQGFRHLRLVKSYYSDGTNALVMQLTL